MKHRPDSKITELIIHCTATPNGRWHTAEDIDRWHGERNFKRSPLLIGHNAPHMPHIGYHFVVLTSGAVQACRGLSEVGAHVRSHNLNSIGVCMVGTDQYTKDQWHALKVLLVGMKSRFKTLRIRGHQQINKDKTCPGFNVNAWLKDKMQVPDGHLLI